MVRREVKFVRSIGQNKKKNSLQNEFSPKVLQRIKFTK